MRVIDSDKVVLGKELELLTRIAKLESKLEAERELKEIWKTLAKRNSDIIDKMQRKQINERSYTFTRHN